MVEGIRQNVFNLDAVVGLDLLAEREKSFEVALPAAGSFHFNIGNIEIMTELAVRTNV